MHKAFLEKLSSATLKFKWGTMLWELLTLGKSRNFYCEFYDGKSSFHFWASFYFLSINYFSNFNEGPTENCYGKLGSLFTYYYYFIIIINIIIITIIIIIIVIFNTNAKRIANLLVFSVVEIKIKLTGLVMIWMILHRST